MSPLWLRFDPWPENFCMPQVWPKKKKKEEEEEESGLTSGSRSFSRQARTSLYNLEEEMGARKEVYSPGMLTPSSAEQKVTLLPKG